MLTVTTKFNVEQITQARKISATVVNVSGRQRMLSQRTAFFALRLICSQDSTRREHLRTCLLRDIELMEKSHHGLIRGDADMQLPGQLSREVKTMYFDPPLNVDKQVREYIQAVRALVLAPDEQLILDNPDLSYIIIKASTELLNALDTVVSQYQKESEAEQLAIDLNLEALYKQSCEATAAAAERSQRLELALYDLQQAQEQLIQTEKLSSLGLMVAGVAHEINNPVNFIYGNLGHIMGYTEDLIELVQLYQKHYSHPHPEIVNHLEDIEFNFLVEDLQKIVSSLQVGAESLRELVQSLKNFSRRDSGKMKAVCLNDGINSTLLMLQHRFKPTSSRPEIQVVKDYGKLPSVECYPGQMNQVFMNILSNAIDAFDETSASFWEKTERTPTITICTEMFKSDLISVRIADNGPGMTEEVKERLFAPFFTTKPVGKGTGLGLSISFQIVVEKHGGALWCASELGRGTEFWIKLPVRQENRGADFSFA